LHSVGLTSKSLAAGRRDPDSTAFLVRRTHSVQPKFSLSDFPRLGSSPASTYSLPHFPRESVVSSSQFASLRTFAGLFVSG
jgi:hypothetical protein